MKYVFILIIGILIACQDHSKYRFEGKWQSLNDPESVIEFTDNKGLILYKNGESFWGPTTKKGELKYEISNAQKNWFDFKAFDGDELFMKGRIETVDDKRIRIYFHKHHNILDLADEYYRTADFNSFPTILEKILTEPE